MALGNLRSSVSSPDGRSASLSRSPLSEALTFLWGSSGGVQISLEKEGVIWKQGILALPRIVQQTVELMQQLLDRLAAVELMLLQKPIVSGRYSGVAL